MELLLENSDQTRLILLIAFVGMGSKEFSYLSILFVVACKYINSIGLIDYMFLFFYSCWVLSFS